MSGGRELLICGTRTFAEEVADLAGEIDGWRVGGFIENWERKRAGETLDGLPIRWVDELASRTGVWAICALVTTKRFAFTAQVEALGIPFATLIHPTARVSPRTTVGDGTLVSAGAVTGTRSAIGRHTIVNRGVLVGHHTTIGDHVSLLPGANVAGNVTVGDRAFVGMGAIVMDGLTIGSRSVIAAGSVVTHDVPDGVQVMGIPARVVGETPDGR
jgi:UDP-perosamine 4-acetyltransferase